MPGVRPNRLDIERYCQDNDIELLLLDDLDEAFLGVITRFGLNEPVAVYDYDIIMELLIERDGMEPVEADEHFSFNIIGAWVGDQTPFFLHRMPEPVQEREEGILDIIEKRKWCPKCKQERPVSAFNRNAARYDGRDSWCRDCFNEHRREKRATEPRKTRAVKEEEGGGILELLGETDG